MFESDALAAYCIHGNDWTEGLTFDKVDGEWIMSRNYPTCGTGANGKAEFICRMRARLEHVHFLDRAAKDACRARLDADYPVEAAMCLTTPGTTDVR